MMSKSRRIVKRIRKPAQPKPISKHDEAVIAAADTLLYAGLLDVTPSLLDAIQSLRRFQHNTLLKDFGCDGKVRVQSQDLSRHIDVLLRAALSATGTKAARQ